METQSKAVAAANSRELLTALAEILLEEGISFSEFNELAREAFVQAAATVLAGEKRVTDSRISILTGIHRKDVKRLRHPGDEDSRQEKAKSNRAIAVISAWTRERDYCDKQGNPIPLAYDDEAPCLVTLIKDYSGDMPVRAVCDELERMGVIEEREGRWHLLLPTYVPNKSRDAIFNFLGEHTGNLVSTFHHNLNHPPRERRFQRSVSYDELSPESVALFQEFASEKSMQLLKEFDSWLSSREKADKRNRKEQASIENVKAGIGIYYFEEGPAKDL